LSASALSDEAMAAAPLDTSTGGAISNSAQRP
jgi:hypothetical protein